MDAFLENNYFLFSYSNDEDGDVLDLKNLNNGQPLRMEDCEAFKCEVVSLGKKAYEIVSKNIYD